MPQTKDVEIDWPNSTTGVVEKQKVTVKRLNFGERNDVIRIAVGPIKVMGGETPTLSVDFLAWIETLLVKSIVAAPFKTGDIGVVRSLPVDVTDAISTVAEELNPFFGIMSSITGTSSQTA